MLKEFLLDSLAFFKIHIFSIAIIILPIYAPVEIFVTLHEQYIASDEFIFWEQILPLTVSMLAYPIYTSAVIFYIASFITNNKIDTITAWWLGIKYWVPFLILSIMVGALVVFGFMLLILPGIFFIVRYAFSQFDLLLKDDSPVDAMKHSWSNTKDYFWIILNGYIIITLVVLIPYYLVTTLFEGTVVLSMIINIIANLIYAVVEVLYIIFALRVYDYARKSHLPEADS